MVKRVVFFIVVFLQYLFVNAQVQPGTELRGVWVATVKNIDWPSKPGLSVEEQKKEILEIINTVKSFNLNVIFLQIRPCCDAFYQSDIEPWSAYLTGVQGENPDLFYDPLRYWIEQSHLAGLELHGWINPFRATMSVNDQLSSLHPVKKHPEWIVEYNHQQWLDPGNPECRNYIAGIVEDIVSRYDIDGIHMDDYFYPYPKAGEIFNDSLSYTLYNDMDFNSNTKDDWRRDNVNRVVIQLNETVKRVKPWVEFGISPFGVWRNKDVDPEGSETKAGMTNYDHLYADVLSWVREEAIDYVVPQIYWDTHHPNANFKTLVDWWGTHTNHISLFAGHALYRLNSDGGIWNDPQQMIDQIKYVRSSESYSGSVFFSYKHLKRDLNGFQDSLKSYYSHTALIPVMIKHIDDPVREVSIVAKKKGKKLKWFIDGDKESVSRYVIHVSDKQKGDVNEVDYIYDITGQDHIRLKNRDNIRSRRYLIVVEAVDCYNRSCGRSAPLKMRF